MYPATSKAMAGEVAGLKQGMAGNKAQLEDANKAQLEDAGSWKHGTMRESFYNREFYESFYNRFSN